MSFKRKSLKLYRFSGLIILLVVVDRGGGGLLGRSRGGLKKASIHSVHLTMDAHRHRLYGCDGRSLAADGPPRDEPLESNQTGQVRDGRFAVLKSQMLEYAQYRTVPIPGSSGCGSELLITVQVNAVERKSDVTTVTYPDPDCEKRDSATFSPQLSRPAESYLTRTSTIEAILIRRRAFKDELENGRWSALRRRIYRSFNFGVLR
ncbi:hypothetical protein B0H11DRAFT_1929192 [Mycena galericulata]|nr:hypothetical protein B0H11DRAFT_1929192 [Mycena galericulata]